MYFPYLRGKQFELIALKELIGLLAKNNNKVSPIIEPVKDSSTLKTTIQGLVSKNINFNIVVNPKVGDMQKDRDILEFLTFLTKGLAGYSNFQMAVILNEKENHKTIINILNKFIAGTKIGLTLIHNAEFENIGKIVKEYETVTKVKYNVLHLRKTGKRYYRNFDLGTVVELDDCFSSQEKNADYKLVEESNFSEEHLYYKQDGFVGFSDFLTIGDIYAVSGFLPYAVAIHISYSNSSKKIKIRHFVSDSNDDTSDIAGKFKEALDKLIAWCNTTKFKTQAIDSFFDMHKTGHFPGLGTVKKLSIMNHIEVVLRLI